MGPSFAGGRGPVWAGRGTSAGFLLHGHFAVWAGGAPGSKRKTSEGHGGEGQRQMGKGKKMMAVRVRHKGWGKGKGRGKRGKGGRGERGGGGRGRGERRRRGGRGWGEGVEDGERGGGGRYVYTLFCTESISVHTYNRIGLKSFIACARKIQTHKRFKRMLIYYDIDTVCTFWGNPFVKLQNDT